MQQPNLCSVLIAYIYVYGQLCMHSRVRYDTLFMYKIFSTCIYMCVCKINYLILIYNMHTNLHIKYAPKIECIFLFVYFYIEFTFFYFLNFTPLIKTEELLSHCIFHSMLILLFFFHFLDYIYIF